MLVDSQILNRDSSELIKSIQADKKTNSTKIVLLSPVGCANPFEGVDRVLSKPIRQLELFNLLTEFTGHNQQQIAVKQDSKLDENKPGYITPEQLKIILKAVRYYSSKITK